MSEKVKKCPNKTFNNHLWAVIIGAYFCPNSARAKSFLYLFLTIFVRICLFFKHGKNLQEVGNWLLSTCQLMSMSFCLSFWYVTRRADSI